MADTPGGPPANLPIDGGPSQRPQQGNDSMKNGARPASAPSSANTPEVQTMEGMIQAARQQVQQTPGTPAPRPTQKQKPQQPGPRPGA
ncbi:MAG: hypothetical protein KC925_02885, partial [Candidatus Doudnabacteria bacterium]|nr:hypothetical protein [Candidatus Doudnabacteria bacterium]